MSATTNTVSTATNAVTFAESGNAYIRHFTSKAGFKRDEKSLRTPHDIIDARYTLEVKAKGKEGKISFDEFRAKVYAKDDIRIDAYQTKQWHGVLEKMAHFGCQLNTTPPPVTKPMDVGRTTLLGRLLIDAGMKCDICAGDEILTMENIAISPCGHVTCQTCHDIIKTGQLTEYGRTRPECPLCRGPLE